MSISIFGVEGPRARYSHTPLMARHCPAPKPSSVLPLRHPADYGNSTHSVCPGTCSRSCVPMRMCPQKHMRWQRSTVKLYLICYLTIFPSSSNGRLPRILQQRTDRHCSRRGKPCLPIPLPKSPPSCHNLALPGLKGSGAVPEMSARAGKSCSRSPCVSCSPGLPGFSSGRIGGRSSFAPEALRTAHDLDASRNPLR